MNSCENTSILYLDGSFCFSETDVTDIYDIGWLQSPNASQAIFFLIYLTCLNFNIVFLYQKLVYFLYSVISIKCYSIV